MCNRETKKVRGASPLAGEAGGCARTLGGGETASALGLPSNSLRLSAGRNGRYSTARTESRTTIETEESSTACLRLPLRPTAWPSMSRWKIVLAARLRDRKILLASSDQREWVRSLHIVYLRAIVRRAQSRSPLGAAGAFALHSIQSREVRCCSSSAEIMPRVFRLAVQVPAVASHLATNAALLNLSYESHRPCTVLYTALYCTALH